jgi:hypothetical protein
MNGFGKRTAKQGFVHNRSNLSQVLASYYEYYMKCFLIGHNVWSLFFFFWFSNTNGIYYCSIVQLFNIIYAFFIYWSVLVYAIFCLFWANMHFERGCRDKKQINGSLSTNRNVIESKRTQKKVPLWIVKRLEAGPHLVWLLGTRLNFLSQPLFALIKQKYCYCILLNVRNKVALYTMSLKCL